MDVDHVGGRYLTMLAGGKMLHHFLVRSWYPVMDNLGKLMYQHKATSLNVPAMGFHFKESEASTIAI